MRKVLSGVGVQCVFWISWRTSDDKSLETPAAFENFSDVYLNKLLVIQVFILLDKSPECSCATTSPNAAQLSCSIFYADATLHPIYANMTWKISDVIHTTDTPSRTRFDYYVFQSTSTITVDNSVPRNFTCIIAFNAPTDIVYDFIATNAPEFSASCSVEGEFLNLLPKCFCSRFLGINNGYCRWVDSFIK